MKQTLTLFLAIFILTSAFAKTNIVVLPEKPAKLNANQILIPIGKNGEEVSLVDLSRMKVKELEAITGKKMKFADKIGFTIAQKQLRNSISSDGTITNQKLNKVFEKENGSSYFHLGGFALGFLLSIIGVLIAYLLKGENRHARVKWAWIGFVASLVIWLIVAVV